MTEATLDVIGIGNALVDVLARVDDDFLTAHGLVKGTMALVPTEEDAEALYAEMPPAVERSGGSVANTIAGIAALGGRAGFVGRIRDDQLGEVFAHDLKSIGVSYAATPATDGPASGRCLILISPDGERTMNTYLGASGLLTPDDIDESFVASAEITYMEGYLFDSPGNREAYRLASAAAQAAGRKVAVTLSDVFCVERHRDEWFSLLVDHIDIVFANDAEIRALYETDDLEHCIESIRSHVEIGVVTLGADGAVIVRGDERIAVPAKPVAEVVDTTGAGDLYAAGFLFGLTSGRTLDDCGRLGAMAASEVIGHVGPRPEADLRELARNDGLL